MKTSYYANLKKIDKEKFTPIAISGDEGKLVGFIGRAERRLSPYTFFKKWKAQENELDFRFQTGNLTYEDYRKFKDQNQTEYIKNFYNKVLKPLNPKEVYNTLGENAVILCFESPTNFCHRHLVGAWLEMNLNIQIDEYGFENDTLVKANKQKLKEQLKQVIENEREVQ